MTIAIKDPKNGKFYRATVSQSWAIRHDNFALVSCGLTVDDDLTRASFNRLGAARVEITHQEWNHMGCQSGCVLRGAKECRW